MTQSYVIDETHPLDASHEASISARAFEAFTRQFLIEAGLRPGMRVLDAWSGAGDCAFLARQIVGPDGHVIGFDQSDQMVSFANERAVFLNLRNVEFFSGQLENLHFGRDFDAIVGRVVLAYRQDPVRDLQVLARFLRPKGLLAFQELDCLSGRSNPPAQVVDEVRQWVIDTLNRVGIELQMGPKLYSAFARAGLQPPRMRLDGLIGGAESLAPMFLANVVGMLLPQLEALGVASSDEVQIETLEERIRLDLARIAGVMQSPLLIGAWTRLPS